MVTSSLFSSGFDYSSGFFSSLAGGFGNGDRSSTCLDSYGLVFGFHGCRSRKKAQGKRVYFMRAPMGMRHKIIKNTNITKYTKPGSVRLNLCFFHAYKAITHKATSIIVIPSFWRFTDFRCQKVHLTLPVSSLIA